MLFERLIQAEKPFRLTNELPRCSQETSGDRSEIFAVGSTLSGYDPKWKEKVVIPLEV